MSVVEKALNDFIIISSLWQQHKNELEISKLMEEKIRRNGSRLTVCDKGELQDKLKNRVNKFKNLLMDYEYVPKLIVDLENIVKAIDTAENCKELYWLGQFLGSEKTIAEGIAIYEVLKHDKYKESMDAAGKAVDELASALKNIYGHSYVVTAKVRSTITAGRGFMDMITEYGLSWDPVLDLPYIPASELKGAVRSLVLKASALKAKMEGFQVSLDLFGKARGKVLSENKDADEYEVFSKILKNNFVVGETEEHLGELVFTDAYPVQAPDNLPVELMVLTPHYTSNVKQEYEVKPTPLRYLGISRKTLLKLL
jgi:Uncharacterized protein predicted to be involved in DNA repair (RAMP superfamily)